MDRRSPARWARRAAHGSRLGVAAAALGATVALAGCASTGSAPALDRAHAAATAHLRERPAEQADELGARVDRDAIVALALARSPSLAALAHRARALVHAGRAEAALPSAELGFAAWDLPLARPYALGEADMYMLELRQRFPAAGGRHGRARALAEEAEAFVAELSAEERLVGERALDAYASYVEAVEARALEQRQLALLERMGEVIRARHSTGGAALADAARIDVELAKRKRAAARSEGDIARARAGLNALLRRPPSAEVAEPLQGPAETVRQPLAALLEQAATHRGAIARSDAKARAAEARREAAEAEARVPEFMAGVGYWQTPGMRPGIGLSASMSLPWLWGPQHERVAQAEEEARAEVAARDAEAVTTQTEVTEAHARLAALEDQLLVLERTALPAARRSADALAAAYATGGVSLLDWLDAARTALDFEVEATALRAELSRAVAALERAVGAPLPRTPLNDEDPR